MKLIDVENIVHEYYKKPSYQQLCKLLNEAPTIEAIPVEWIENWLNSFYRWINGTKYYMGDGYDSAATMLREWREENEQVNSKN